VLKPSSELIKKYLSEIENLRSNANISEEDYILLRDSFVAENLLLETTHNDPDRFSPKTPLEILEKIRQEGFKEYLKEREEHEKTKKELQREKEEKKKFYDLWGKGQKKFLI